MSAECGQQARRSASGSRASSGGTEQQLQPGGTQCARRSAALLRSPSTTVVALSPRPLPPRCTGADGSEARSIAVRVSRHLAVSSGVPTSRRPPAVAAAATSQKHEWSGGQHEGGRRRGERASGRSGGGSGQQQQRRKQQRRQRRSGRQCSCCSRRHHWQQQRRCRRCRAGCRWPQHRPAVLHQRVRIRAAIILRIRKRRVRGSQHSAAHATTHPALDARATQ